MSDTNGFILRQMFDKESYTFTYILGDLISHEAVLIDPVFEKVERDLGVVDQLGLQFKYVMNTHVHADHITGTGLLKRMLGKGVKSVISFASEAHADIRVKEGDIIKFGRGRLDILSTPGHTSGCLTFVFHQGRMAFTGDALLIGGCGRTDMQGGCSVTLYYSIHHKILRLPGQFVVYPAHDYKGRTSSTIREEKLCNKRINLPIMEFTRAMQDLAVKLGPPRLLDVAVPANLACGLYDLPSDLKHKLQKVKKRKNRK